jgi:hypothetical protein
MDRGGQVSRKFPSGFFFFCSVERDRLRRAIQAVVPFSCARQRSRQKEEEGGGGGDTREEVTSDLFLICFSDDLLQTSPLAPPPLPFSYLSFCRLSFLPHPPSVASFKRHSHTYLASLTVASSEIKTRYVPRGHCGRSMSSSSAQRLHFELAVPFGRRWPGPTRDSAAWEMRVAL